MNALGPLYHWSPRERRLKILHSGLLPLQRNVLGPVFHGLDGEDDGRGEFLQPAVCLSPTPATAWAYSHGAWKTEGVFDLWEVRLDHTDEVHILPMWGDHIVEVRVHNRIPKSRLIWIGERTVP